MLVSVAQVEATALRALACAGVPSDHARIQVRLLVEAELRGHPSHGLLRLPRIVERIANGVADPRTCGRHTWHREAFLQVDGEDGLGPVVAEHALRTVSERARSTGVALAAISRSNHLGMLAVYAEEVARGGQILIGLTTSEALVHPWGGRHAMLGTNPVTIGVPADPHPFVLDMATGTVSMGKIHDHAARGLALQPGWALDEHGDPTIDAVRAKRGAIAPFGDAKGYGLGLAFEVMVTAVAGSAIGRDVHGTLDATETCTKGDLFMVIDPAHEDRSAVSKYLDLVRDCEPVEAGQRVLIPGDRARSQRARMLRQGIPVHTATWQRIAVLAGRDPAPPT